MTQPSILHLVVNWKVFTIYICCFIAKNCLSYLHLFHLSLRSGGQVYTTMKIFVKIGHTVYEISHLIIIKMVALRHLGFLKI